MADQTSMTPTIPVMNALDGASATPGYRAVEIRLVAGDAGVPCQFWVGLAKRGQR